MSGGIAQVATSTGVGRALRLARVSAGLTQGQVAERIGVVRQTVGSWEAEGGGTDPSPSDLQKLAELYGVSVNALGDVRALDLVMARAGVVRESANATYHPRLPKRMPPKLYELVHGFLTRLADAGVSEDEVDEAERLMVDYSYSKLHSRDGREPTEEDRMIQARAIWSVIEETFRDKGVKL